MQLQERIKRIIPNITDDEAIDYLDMAKEIVLTKRFPFGYTEEQEVEIQYRGIQLQIAIDLYNKQGAEGQSEHTENGVKRVYNDAENLLNSIVPKAKVSRL